VLVGNAVGEGHAKKSQADVFLNHVHQWDYLRNHLLVPDELPRVGDYPLHHLAVYYRRHALGVASALLDGAAQAY